MAQDEKDNPGPETPEINATTYGGEERNGGATPYQLSGGEGGEGRILTLNLASTRLSRTRGSGLGFSDASAKC